jgi:hypothetical protein
MEITGFFSLLAIVLYKIKSAFASKAFLAAFAFSAITFVAMAWAGNLGGKIRHPETSNTVINVEKGTTNSQPENDE